MCIGSPPQRAKNECDFQKTCVCMFLRVLDIWGRYFRDPQCSSGMVLIKKKKKKKKATNISKSGSWFIDGSHWVNCSALPQSLFAGFFFLGGGERRLNRHPPETNKQTYSSFVTFICLSMFFRLHYAFKIAPFFSSPLEDSISRQNRCQHESIASYHHYQQISLWRRRESKCIC